MGGLWSKNPETPEGKYPIVLRRDGTPLKSSFIVMVLKDPCVSAALMEYAVVAQRLGMDPEYVTDIRDLARESAELAAADKTSDPDAPKHRPDDPVVLAWARSIGCPGS